MSEMEGSLSKWTNVMKGWQYRWFVLDDNAGLLTYYTSKEKMMRGVRRGCVLLKGAELGIDDEDDNLFSITVNSKTFHFQARDCAERDKWIRCLEDTILRHAHGYNSFNLLQLDSFKPSLTIEDFEKKICEADAYLQILIDQIKSIEQKMETELDISESNNYVILLSQANNFVEQVKNAIVLLQLSKVNKISEDEEDSSSDMSCSDTIGNIVYPINRTFPPISDSLDGHSKHDAATHLVSSSDEEDFQDASDSTVPLDLPHSRKIDDSDLIKEDLMVSLNTNAVGDSASPFDFLKPDGSLDYDAIYEDAEETCVSVDSHKSVVTHLISQVRIGMDLTKVVLPTFILERRSLLEMYADYFAHPDMFIKISDLTSERERMVQVLKWYLCSYHAGRKSSVAKKPYNPILGEVFQCYWNIPGLGSLTDPVLMSDGPLPWCHADHLIFVAEQVSHHPPISAFYAEHYNKKISFSANIWTKSKFLGLSIGVHNIGSGVVDVIVYDEQYIVTFPNGYARSILTVPWIELGGTVTIDCQKTGYRATLEFLTKPFYGGRKHRVYSQVFAPDEKKPFLTVTGEWNGIMEAKWSNGMIEEFANVNSLAVVRKNVRPIDEQNDNESRKIWKEVTAGLRLNHVAHATDAKCVLEQKQRSEAQQRIDAGIDWETKLFHQEDCDRWAYINPLSRRLKSASTRRYLPAT